MYFSIYPTRIKDSTIREHLFPNKGNKLATKAEEAQLPSKESIPPPTPLPTWIFPTFMLADSRDEAFLQYSVVLTLTMVPSALYLLFAPTENIYPAHLVFHCLYTVYNIRKYLLMLHCSSHRRMFKREYGLLNHWVPALGWFMGQTINSYYVHHVKMHHVADNGPKDASSTLTYQRDNFLHFLHYFFRFYFLGWYDLMSYFIKTKQYYYLSLYAIGEPVSFAMYGYFLYTRPLSALSIFIIPFNFTRFGMMMGNFTQHAFLDHDDPANDYKNSITCVQTSYNDYCFNDGYHASHHINPIRHWSEHPDQLYDTRETYKSSSSIIFKDVDYEWIFVRLMLHDYRSLASKVVWLGKEGADYPITHTSKVEEWLKAKTRVFTSEEIAKLYPEKKTK